MLSRDMDQRLAHLDAAKGKGKYSGSKQEVDFAAKFRDAQHIEEAPRCHVSVTFDGGAAKLAEAVFAYARCNTQVIILPSLKE